VNLRIFPDKQTMSVAAADRAAAAIQAAIGARGRARVVAATGASQIAFLEALTGSDRVHWPAVELFHLDEYIGLPVSHPASFRRFLRERLVEPAGIRTFHELDGEDDPVKVCERVGRLIAAEHVDVAFLGIGENGHLAFNDPPADFECADPYIVVALDEACRRQQVGEGWFAGLDDVPRTAISMSVRQILNARELLVIVPDTRKAVAVKATLEGEITPMVPASILRTHPNATLYLDDASASALGARN
jgi:glucosamine-6-phosphate deaminase